LRYRGLKIVVGRKIFVGKCTGELGGFGGKSSYRLSMNQGGVGSALGLGEIIGTASGDIAFTYGNGGSVGF
jgi:hypothetical protein